MYYNDSFCLLFQCTAICTKYEFRCDTYCVNIAKWCDGNYDCGAKDETTCGGDNAYGEYRARNVFKAQSVTLKVVIPDNHHVCMKFTFKKTNFNSTFEFRPLQLKQRWQSDIMCSIFFSYSYVFVLIITVCPRGFSPCSSSPSSRNITGCYWNGGYCDGTFDCLNGYDEENCSEFIFLASHYKDTFRWVFLWL